MSEPVSSQKDTCLFEAAITRFRRLLVRPEDITWENEVQANLFVANVLIATALLDLVFILLTLLDVFAVERRTLLSILIPAFILLVIPASVCYRLKGERAWLKLFLFFPIFWCFLCSGSF